VVGDVERGLLGINQWRQFTARYNSGCNTQGETKIS
jgi:hypothetical protein